MARAKGISTVPPFQEHLSLELSRTHTRAPKQKGSESRVGAQGLWSSPTALIGWHLSPPRGRAPLTGLVAAQPGNRATWPRHRGLKRQVPLCQLSVPAVRVLRGRGRH